jgi:metal-responsive CopG/Arc/MetJ family transcriptional regulator
LVVVEKILGGAIMARVLISMPDEFLSAIDGVADEEQRSRSELIREALRTYVNRKKLRTVATASKNAALLEAIL